MVEFVDHEPGEVVDDGSHGKDDAAVASLYAGGGVLDETVFVAGLKNLVWYSHLPFSLALQFYLEEKFVFIRESQIT